MLKLLKSPLRLPISAITPPDVFARYRTMTIARARARAEWLSSRRNNSLVCEVAEPALTEPADFSAHPIERIASAWGVAGVADVSGIVAAGSIDALMRSQLARIQGHSHGIDADLICDLVASRIGYGEARALVASGGALEQLGFVEVVNRADGTSIVLATQRLLGLFEGFLVSDSRLAAVVSWRACDPRDSVGVITDEEMGNACESIKRVVEACSPPVALLIGPSGCGRARLAGAIASAIGFERLAVVDVALLPREASDLAIQLRRIETDVRFLHALLVIRGIDAGDTVKLRNLSALLPTVAVPTILTSTSDDGLADLERVLGAKLRIRRPDAPLRREAWKLEVENRGIVLDDSALDQLAATFALTRSAIARTTDLAIARDGSVTLAGLLHCAASQVHSQLERYAKRSLPTDKLSHLVLESDVRSQLSEIVRAVKMRRSLERMYGGRLNGPRGVAALFNGPPGTGKTLSAAALACELGMPLYRIDVSSIVDRYVGETEKNLARVFEEAESERGLLLFDEADSLFTKRVEVGDANDRYANMQVNMLLNLIDDYSGLVVLTTNLKASIDVAFLRRMSFKITFELPDVEERVALWKHHIPREVPIVRGIDIVDLATRYKASGGEIRNAVYRAVLMGEGAPLDGDSLERSICLELEGSGNVVRRGSSLRD